MANYVYPLGVKGAVIGGPNQGSHGAGAPRNWESRNAVDIKVPDGTPVYAVAAGTIGGQIGYLGNPSDTGRFAGQRLHLKTGSNEFYYAHLSKLAVKAGEHVRAGQLLGYTGSANGVAHLHFAEKTGDPASVIRGAPITQGGATDTTDATAQQTDSAAAPVDGTPQYPGVVGVSQPPPVAPPQPTETALPEPGSTNFALPNLDASPSWQMLSELPNLSADTQRYLALIGG